MNTSSTVRETRGRVKATPVSCLPSTRRGGNAGRGISLHVCLFVSSPVFAALCVLSVKQMSVPLPVSLSSRFLWINLNSCKYESGEFLPQPQFYTRCRRGQRLLGGKQRLLECAQIYGMYHMAKSMWTLLWMLRWFRAHYSVWAQKKKEKRAQFGLLKDIFRAIKT